MSAAFDLDRVERALLPAPLTLTLILIGKNTT
jgi:hypothetical protein